MSSKRSNPGKTSAGAVVVLLAIVAVLIIVYIFRDKITAFLTGNTSTTGTGGTGNTSTTGGTSSTAGGTGSISSSLAAALAKQVTAVPSSTSSALLATPAPSTPVGPATPSIKPPSTAIPTGAAETALGLMNFYFEVEVAGKPRSGMRIDVAGVDYLTVGILYTSSNGIANFLKNVPGRYGYVVYYNSKKQTEGIANFTWDGQTFVIGLSGVT